MFQWIKSIVGTLLVLAVIGGLGWGVWQKLQTEQADTGGGKKARGPAGPVPVEVGVVRHEPIELRRAFSGTLEASASFTVAPKVSGRVVRLAVDLADTVKRGQVIAELDNDEYQQAVTQAVADLAVAKANLAEAKSGGEITRRDLERVSTLRERGVASEAQFDAAQSAQLAKLAQIEVAKAQVTRAEAAVEAAKIRLGYTTVSATWADGDDQRVVSARFIDEGDTVAANTPMLSIVELDPIKGVVFVTERDYARLKPNQRVTLTTDAYPGERFNGRIARVSPVFQQASRQARVELVIDNPERRLKPGMFIRAEAILDRVEDAVIVHADALTKRDGRMCVFVLNGDGATVARRFVEVGIRNGDHVQVIGDGVEGRVVTLGQQLLDDGSKVIVPQSATSTATPAKPEADSE
ncbi:MAG: efflux RND transporter periplasmic adaptor subunit [Phycisphaera sp.]|nr:efflux RND transporter periplasmic adaptor subunit [Phycisphaera sp.]